MALGIKNMPFGITVEAGAKKVSEMEMSVGAGYAQTLFDFAVARGANAQTLAHQSGYDPDCAIDPEARITFSTYKNLMRTAKLLSGDPALPLYFGAESHFRDMSIVGLITHAAPTMGEAFKQMNRFARLAIEVEGHSFQSRFCIVLRDGETWLQDDRLNPNDFSELTESTFARFICETARYFGDVPFAKHIQVTHAKPAHAEEYLKILSVPVAFDSPYNAISIDPSWLEIKLTTPNAYAFGIFNERATLLLHEISRQSTLRAKVEAALIPRLHTGVLDIQATAQNLGLSRASLYRRLAEEGTTYAQIVDELRHKFALDYLSARKVSVSECAYLVGFSDPGSFSRAFKRWTGRSPNEIK
jgi:AraC-like DNA-binding protein